MFFDTHVHFDLLGAASVPDDVEIRDVIQRAVAAGVTRMLAVGGAPAANRQAIALAQRHPGQVRAAAALDRARAPDPAELSELTDLSTAPEIAAIGETGLDFHYGGRDEPGQRAQFHAMLQLACARQLPVIVHSREADREVLDMLAAHAAAWTGAADAIGVLHCFTGGPDYARRLLDLGFCISFSGIITFKNAAAVRAAAAIVPDDRLLLETDAPFLAPEPCRGRRNEPALLPHTAAALAQLRGQPRDHIARLTTANALRLFPPRPSVMPDGGLHARPVPCFLGASAIRRPVPLNRYWHGKIRTIERGEQV